MDVKSSKPSSRASPVAAEQPPPPEPPPDVEAIMTEIRLDAARAAGRPPPAGNGGDKPGVYVGVDDEAVVRRVMERLARIKAVPPEERAGRTPPEHAAREMAVPGARPRGWLHRQLGKARRWLFRVTKVQAELERLQERLNQDMVDLEQRTSQSVMQLQQYLASRSAERGEVCDIDVALPDHLHQRVQARFRGSEEEIRRRAGEYLPFIREAAGRAKAAGRYDLLDVGCGRGELLELAAERGLVVRGIDSNELMVRACRAKGLPVERVGLREFLLHCPEADVRCVTLVHVVEHIHVSHLPALLVELKRVIAPGGRLMMEFPNIGNLLTGSNYFYIDHTHGRPLHRETVKLFCEAAGFSGVFSHELHPADEQLRLRGVEPSLAGAEQLNETVDRLNDLLYGPQDVLVVAER